VRVIVEKSEAGADKLGFEYLEGPVKPKADKVPDAAPKKAKRKPRSGPRKPPKKSGGGGSSGDGGGGGGVRTVPKVPLVRA